MLFIRVIQVSLPIVILTIGDTAYAAQLCGGDPLADLFCSEDLAGMLNSAFKISIYLGGVLAMLRISYAGWLYMGSDMWSSKTHAKDVFRDAIIGLLILMSIYMILYQINPDILKLRILQPGQSYQTAPGRVSDTVLPSSAQGSTWSAQPSINSGPANQNTDASTGNATIDNGCSTAECQAQSGLGATPGIAF